jgi:hypothetical protein
VIDLVVRLFSRQYIGAVLLAILLQDRDRTEVKIREFLLSVAELAKLHQLFVSGALHDDSLSRESFGFVEKIFKDQW